MESKGGLVLSGPCEIEKTVTHAMRVDNLEEQVSIF